MIHLYNVFGYIKGSGTCVCLGFDRDLQAAWELADDLNSRFDHFREIIVKQKNVSVPVDRDGNFRIIHSDLADYRSNF